jgi:hypothetical protein
MGSVFGFGVVPQLADVHAVLLAVGGLFDERASDPFVADRNVAGNRILRESATSFGDRQVLMTNMTRDDHFPIDGALEVFGLIPGPKRMGLWEGTHEQLTAEAMTMAVDFFRVAPGGLTHSGASGRRHARCLSGAARRSGAAVHAVDARPQCEPDTPARHDEWEQPLLERHTGDVRERHR